MAASKLPPRRIRVDRETAVTIEWADGSRSVYPVAYLRRHCPCATCREQSAEEDNPLRVLPPGAEDLQAVTIESVEPVGRYAIRFRFSDGHAGGIYSWEYLAQLEPPESGASESG